jgi:hypothetical protein
MRTTVDIPDPIYRELKERAAREGTSVKQIILRSVVSDFRQPESTAPRKRLKFPIIKSKQLGTLEIDNERIYDLIGFP